MQRIYCTDATNILEIGVILVDGCSESMTIGDGKALLPKPPPYSLSLPPPPSPHGLAFTLPLSLSASACAGIFCVFHVY